MQTTVIAAPAGPFLALCALSDRQLPNGEMIALDDTLVETLSGRAEIWIDGRHESLSQARSACGRLVANAHWQPEAQEDLVLVVSELVTNACRHSPGPCRMNLEVSNEAAIVEVWDSSPHVPALPDPFTARACEEEPACSGYGLGIVAALSTCLEFFPQEIGGKTVRAVVVP
ncbi:ATP-binding protein [Streptomyces sp. NPDC048191]|uniref:ATP-binding protein n=1 Tax=Streptomyces sp. NPDC048191 TaxID=3155484 RepID=UPI00340174EA